MQRRHLIQKKRQPKDFSIIQKLIPYFYIVTPVIIKRRDMLHYFFMGEGGFMEHIVMMFLSIFFSGVKFVLFYCKKKKLIYNTTMKAIF